MASSVVCSRFSYKVRSLRRRSIIRGRSVSRFSSSSSGRITSSISCCQSKAASVSCRSSALLEPPVAISSNDACNSFSRPVICATCSFSCCASAGAGVRFNCRLRSARSFSTSRIVSSNVRNCSSRDGAATVGCSCVAGTVSAGVVVGWACRLCIGNPRTKRISQRKDMRFLLK